MNIRNDDYLINVYDTCQFKKVFMIIKQTNKFSCWYNIVATIFMKRLR